MQLEMSTLSNEVNTLRSQIVTGSGYDEDWALKLSKIESEREYFASKWRTTENQVASAKRQESMVLLNSVSCSEHDQRMKKKKDELVAELKTQLSKGYAEMKRPPSEAAEVAVAEQKADISQLALGRQHLVHSLAESMNEVTKLRNTHNGFSQGDLDEQHQE